MSGREVTALCGQYLGDNDATCPQLTCIRDRDHDGLCDNVRGDHAEVTAAGLTDEEILAYGRELHAEAKSSGIRNRYDDLLQSCSFAVHSRVPANRRRHRDIVASAINARRRG